jgi:hypothetical protein
MSIPAWPADIPYAPDLNSISPIKRMLDPIATDMEGGNTRLRSRPGDNVGTISQTVVMKAAQFDAFVAWVKDGLGNGTSRFTVPVRLGAAFETKVCQFSGGAPTYRPVGTKAFAVSMTLRVYNV